jgi:hypothetical protein
LYHHKLLKSWREPCLLRTGFAYLLGDISFGLQDNLIP